MAYDPDAPMPPSFYGQAPSPPVYGQPPPAGAPTRPPVDYTSVAQGMGVLGQGAGQFMQAAYGPQPEAAIMRRRLGREPRQAHSEMEMLFPAEPPSQFGLERRLREQEFLATKKELERQRKIQMAMALMNILGSASQIGAQAASQAAPAAAAASDRKLKTEIARETRPTMHGFLDALAAYAK